MNKNQNKKSTSELVNYRKIEEHIDNEYGFDYEDNDDSSENGKEKPYNADVIRIDQQMLSLRYLDDLINQKLLDLSPDFQRKPVWNEPKRKSRLIESLMLRIPIPAFYFYENEEAIFQVIDGQQRLHTIHDYLNGDFKLSGLEYLGDEYDECYFNDLPEKYKQRINRTQFAVNVLDTRSPKRVIYDIFRRVNTGGLRLSPQEMRNALCTRRVRTFLQKGANSEEFLLATDYRVKDGRMDAQELVLMFHAIRSFYDFGEGRLVFSNSKINELLDEYVYELAKMEDNELLEKEITFKNAMTKCRELFDEYCFMKIEQTENGNIEKKVRSTINRSLFVSFSVLLSDISYSNKNLSNYRVKALKKLSDKLKMPEYSNAISMATNDKKVAEQYFKFAKEVLSDVLEN